MVFSVKTGKQSSPALIRELEGTMKQQRAIMGGLILDADPSQKMEEVATKAGKLVYPLETRKGNVEQNFNKVQILTSQEIIECKYFVHPPTLAEKRKNDRYRDGLDFGDADDF